MTVELDYRVPSADLADYVTLFYHFRCSLPRFEDVERADHAQLRFRLKGSGTCYRFADGTEQRPGPVHLIGPTTGSVTSSGTGPIELVGLGLTPAGWGALVRSDAAAMCNRTVDCADVFDGVDGMLVALRIARDTDAKVAAVEDYLRRLIAGRAGEAIDFTRAVDTWLADHPSPRLEALEAATGLSRRQVERRCNALYGAPPKLLARKYRALRAAVALVAEGHRTDDLLARGFYDQSHLIREIKHFTGCTPRQLRANPSILAQLTIHQRSGLAGQVIPLISHT